MLELLQGMAATTKPRTAWRFDSPAMPHPSAVVELRGQHAIFLDLVRVDSSVERDGYAFSFSKKCLRAFATFGAITAVQYRWLGLLRK